jgi:hypothetical protein
MNKAFLLIVILSLNLFSHIIFAAAEKKCASVFTDSVGSRLNSVSLSNRDINAKELMVHTSRGIELVPEFRFLREQAAILGIRVWLFGGTASSYLHYVKWDLARNKGILKILKDRFDYDYTNIFRSTQDLDIVVDATVEQAKFFQNLIEKKYPHFLGANAKWEVRTLRNRIAKPGDIGFKEALLNDPDFTSQNTDSNSLGMVEISVNKTEPLIRDLKNWDNPISLFLEDTLKNQISFFRSKSHFSTFRAKSGENPEILSVIRLLVKAFQYGLSFSKEDSDQMKDIITKFDGRNITNSNALRRIQDTAIKLVMHAENIEYAMNKIEALGLRSKLIAMGDATIQNTNAWWLNREPLRTYQIGQGRGLTAAELKIEIVAHETNNFLAYESITRSHSGEPNVLISRESIKGESAAYGEGFYTRIGREGAAGTGLTIRFRVNPNAREGSDFKKIGDFIIFKNKKALTVIQESLNFGIDDLLKLANSNQELKVEDSDLALIEKLKRKLNTAKLTDELKSLLNSKNENDYERLIQIILAFQNTHIVKLLSKEVLDSVIKNIYLQVSTLAGSTNEKDQLRYIQSIGSVIATLESLDIMKIQDFLDSINKIITTKHFSSFFREKIFYEKLFFIDNMDQLLKAKEGLSAEELSRVVLEINNWYKSTDSRKRKFIVNFNNIWSEAIKNGDLQSIKSLISSGFFNINYRNISDVSILQLTAYYMDYDYSHRKNKYNYLMNWLLENPNFNINAKNNLGYTEVEQLKLLGKSELAAEIMSKRPEAKTRDFNIQERNSDHSPVVDFIEIAPGSFVMGESNNKVLTTISKPFEIMSIHMTEDIFVSILGLIKEKFNEEYLTVSYSPSIEYRKMMPIVHISYFAVEFWIKHLNLLSNLNDSKVQEILKVFFPGHKMGAQYRLPTDAEWEFVARLGGVAEGDYPFGNEESELIKYAVYTKNSGGQLNSIGSKKPLFYHGKAIYDFLGNVQTWTSTWHDNILTGGIDPQGPKIGDGYRILRGGCFFNESIHLKNNYRILWGPAVRNDFVGFRIVRAIN